CQKYSYTPFTF
nr:immunoglobulin light chain junction region [Macaca mulatta]